MTHAQINMNGGEISPYLHYRGDLDKHASGLAQCRNFIPLPYGGVRKRPGTQYLETLDDATGQDQMHPFRGTDGKRYILIFTVVTFYAYDIENETLHDQALAWPITADQLPDLRVIAINDVLFLTSPYHHPLKLSYTNATTWTIEKITFTESPKLDENLLENTKISVLSNPLATTWVTATAYTVGNNRLSTDGTCEYTCTLNHTSSAARQPGVGEKWREYWRVTTYAEGTSVSLKTHIGIANWSVSAVSYARLAYVDYNGTPYRCLIAHTSGVSTTPGAETVIGSHWEKCIDVFNSIHVASDSTFKPAANFTTRIRRDDQTNQTSLNAWSGNDGLTSTAILIRGPWTFTTYGTWSGTFTVQRSRDSGTNYETVSTHQASKDRNISIAGDESEAVYMRLLFTKDGSTGTSGDHRGVLEPASAYVDARFDIASYTSTRSVTATVRGISYSGTTNLWRENAFNRLQGYPRAVALHERRLFFAGTSSQPLGLWGSVTEDFLNFSTGTADDDSIFVVLAASTQNPIQWLSSQRRLFLGTEFSEWVIGNETTDNPITPTNFLARQYTTYGSAAIAPINIGDAVIFIQRHANRIREMAYISENETYDSADLSRLAEHLFTGAGENFSTGYNTFKINAIAWQQSQNPTLWAVRNDGTLLSFSYIRQERLSAWASHDSSWGVFKNVVVSPNDTDDDEIYFLVYRIPNSAYTLERIQSNATKRSESLSINEGAPNMQYPAIYDCQIVKTGLSVGSVMPQHDIMGTASKFIDPDSYSQNTITEKTPWPGFPAIVGSVPPEWTVPSENVITGSTITAELTTLPIEAATPTGSSLAKKKRLTKILAHLLYGRLLQVRQNHTPANTETFTTAENSYDTYRHDGIYENASATKLYAGWVEASTQISGNVIQAKLKHDAPTPCTITALVAEMEVYQP